MTKKTDIIYFEALFLLIEKKEKSFKWLYLISQILKQKTFCLFKTRETKETYKLGGMAEWSNASDLKSDEPNKFREFKSHSLLFGVFLIQTFY